MDADRKVIVKTPGIVGGRPRIEGTRISVENVVIEVVHHGVTPEDIVARYWKHLTLAQVHAALGYYHSNKADIDAAIEQDRALYDEAAEAARLAGQGRVPASA